MGGMDWEHSTVLVTGGAGFIGSHLVEELVDAGADVRVADDLSSGTSENLTAVSEPRRDHRLVHCKPRSRLHAGESRNVITRTVMNSVL